VNPDTGFLARGEDLLGLTLVVGGAAFGLFETGIARELKPVQDPRTTARAGRFP
jgi:hypothetical protein